MPALDEIVTGARLFLASCASSAACVLDDIAWKLRNLP